MSNESTNIIETMSSELEHLRPMEASLEMAEADVKAYKQRIAVLEKEVARLKTEADKVIAELKDDVTYWKKVAKKNMDDNVAMARERAKAFESEHRRKHKQCVAMARWCESKVYHIRRTPLCDMDEHEGWQHDDEFWQRWHKRWLELAEKFKEAK